MEQARIRTRFDGSRVVGDGIIAHRVHTEKWVVPAFRFLPVRRPRARGAPGHPGLDPGDLYSRRNQRRTPGEIGFVDRLRPARRLNRIRQIELAVRHRRGAWAFANRWPEFARCPDPLQPDRSVRAGQHLRHRDPAQRMAAPLPHTPVSAGKVRRPGRAPWPDRR